MEAGFEILYEDGPCLVVNKPPGLLTQAPPGIDSLESRVKAFLAAREAKAGRVYLGVPHRLDRPASGAIVFARHSRAARRLAEQFEGRRVRKVYWACVEGPIQPDEGSWSDYIRKVPDQAKAEVVDLHHPDGRLAVLHYRVRETWEAGTWLEIELETGRMHQIRIQAASRGHPVWGDFLYGAITTFGPQWEDTRLRAIALHARQLAFDHPKSRVPVSISAPVPAPWFQLGLAKLTPETPARLPPGSPAGTD